MVNKLHTMSLDWRSEEVKPAAIMAGHSGVGRLGEIAAAGKPDAMSASTLDIARYSRNLDIPVHGVELRADTYPLIAHSSIHLRSIPAAQYPKITCQRGEYEPRRLLDVYFLNLHEGVELAVARLGAGVLAPAEFLDG